MKGNIMIIDDSSIDRKIIRQVLNRKLEGVTLFESEDGFDIVRKLADNNIHVCILDIIMPLKNGFTILQEIKKEPAVMDIPIIVCTGLDNEETIEEALSMGAYDYFSKPLSSEAIKISLPLKVKNAIEFMKRREEILDLSFHDKLTGLYNRRFFEEEMKMLNIESSLPLSFVLIDANGLKLTNDAFGHKEGDKLIIKIADILKKECSSDEFVARIGGDEFVMILPNTNEEMAQKIMDRLRGRCDTDSSDIIKPSFSMGCATKTNINQRLYEIYKLAEERMYAVKLVESKRIRYSIIASLKKTLYARYYETEAHSKNMIQILGKLEVAFNLSPEQVKNLHMLALYHDIGLAAIPDYIIYKDGDLTTEENDIMKGHSEIGYRIACSLPEFARIADDILYYYEQWDGNGYPQGLKGEEIPFHARLMSVIDTYDIVLNGRFHRKQKSREETLSIIKEKAGSWFDPKIVDVFLGEMK